MSSNLYDEILQLVDDDDDDRDHDVERHHDENQSEEEEEEDFNAKKKNKNKNKKNKSQTKKKRPRSISSNDDEDEDEDDGDEDDDDDDARDDEDPEYKMVMQWGDDFMGNSKDRANLMKLSEMEREAILAERAEKKQAVLERMEIMRKLNQSGNHRTSTGKRTTGEKVGRKKAIETFKKERERKKRRRGSSISSSSSSSDASSSESDDSSHHRRTTRGRRPRRRRTRSSSTDSRSSSADSRSSSYERRLLERDSKQRQKEELKRQKEEEELEKAILRAAPANELFGIVLTRSDLSSWMWREGFRDSVVGCFVRVSIIERVGDIKVSSYKLLMITDTYITSKPYRTESGPSNRRIKLNISPKSHSEPLDFAINFISSSPPTMNEYEAYIAACRSEKCYPVDRDHVDKMKKQIHEARNYTMTHEEFNKMLEEKRRLKDGGSSSGVNGNGHGHASPSPSLTRNTGSPVPPKTNNPVAEKLRLLDLLQTELSHTEREKVEMRLKEVETLMKSKELNVDDKLELVNIRNRTRNAMIGETTRKEEKKDVNGVKSDGNGGEQEVEYDRSKQTPKTTKQTNGYQPPVNSFEADIADIELDLDLDD